MAQDIIKVSRATPTQKRQPYNWVPNIKISELLDYTVTKRSCSSSSRRPSERGNTASTETEQSSQLLLRGSPVVTPWSQRYKELNAKSSSIRQKPSCNLADVEKKLSSLALKHTEDEIYGRHFINDLENGDTTEEQNIVEDVSSVHTSSKEQVGLPALRRPLRVTRTVYRPPRQVKYPSKSSKRHRFCLSKYPHSRRNQKRYYVKEADEIQHEVTVDQKGLKEAWEYHVLGKLSDETQCFISHRFDGKEKPKEKLIDFLDAGYRDKDRVDYMTKRKRRLFDMPYKHDEFPGASTHL